MPILLETKRLSSRPHPESLLSLPNVSLAEGDAGSTNMVFTLSRTADQNPPIGYDYETLPGTATPNVDYTPVAGSGSIAGGQSKQIAVPIIGDTDVEPNETFTLRVYNVRYL